MNSKTFLTIAVVLAVVYALGFLIIPEAVLDIYGVAVNPSAILMARFFGTALLGLGIIFWLVRSTTDRTVLRGFAIYNAVGVGVSTWGTLAGIMSQVGWSATVIYSLLFIGCLIANPEK